MGGKMSRTTKISRQDSDTDLFDQNVTPVNTPQTPSNNNLSNSGTTLGNQQQTALPALAFTGTPRNSNQDLTATGSNSNLNEQNSVPEINGNVDPDQLTRQNSTGELMHVDNSEVEQSAEETLPPEDLDNPNSDMEKNNQNSNESNQTHQIFIPAYMAEETVDNDDVPDSTSISVDTDDALSGSSSLASSVDQTLQNVTSASGIEFLHSNANDSNIPQDGVSWSSSSNCLSSDQLLKDMEEYNNELKDSSIDLSESDEYFEQSSGTSIENETPNSDMEELTESQEDMEFRSSLKQLMDRSISPGASAAVSSDTQCHYSTSGDQTITDPVPRNCISEGEICDNTTPVSPALNNKRKSDGDVQDESQSKRLAVEVEVPTENDVEIMDME